MARLSDVPLSTSDIDINGTTVTFRGLSLADLAKIVPRHGAQMALMFGKVYQGGVIEADSISTIARVLAVEAPDLMAEVIALASDDDTPKAIEVAKRIPFSTQITILDAIYQNTFSSEADVKKLREVITRMVLSAALAIEQMTPGLLSGAGIGTSDAK